MNILFDQRLKEITQEHETLLKRKNEPIIPGNGIYTRYKYPVLTAMHTPLMWRYDFNPASNPFLMERFGINGTFNAGAIKWDGKYIMVVRVEGNDRKSFFAIAESPNGIDNFRFIDYPVAIPETENPDINIYDMRLTKMVGYTVFSVLNEKILTHRREIYRLLLPLQELFVQKI